MRNRRKPKRSPLQTAIQLFVSEVVLLITALKQLKFLIVFVTKLLMTLIFFKFSLLIPPGGANYCIFAHFGVV